MKYSVFRFVIGREKDMNKSEILNLIQRSLQMDQEREEMSRNFQQYHDAYYEQHFTDEDSENLKEQKSGNHFEIEILKQCYESLEKTLETTEKDKEHYQVSEQGDDDDHRTSHLAIIRTTSE